MTSLISSESAKPLNYVYTSRAALKAALRIAAKLDIRYYLNGVNIEADSTSTRLIATDGHRMLIIHRDAENSIQEPVSFIIPRDIVRQIIAGGGKALANVQIDIRPEGPGLWSAPLLHIGNRTRLTFAQIEGKFPNWRAVVPKTISGKAAQLNPEYLAEMNAAAADLGSSHVTVSHNGTEPALVLPQSQIAEKFIGIVMPMRDATLPAWTPPTWCAAPKNSQEQSQ